MTFRSNNIQAWSCNAENDFHEHGVTEPRAQSLAVVKSLPRNFNKYAAHSMSTSGVSET